MATQAPPKAAPGKAAVRPRSFLVGTQAVVEGNDYDQTVLPGAAGVNAQPWALQATGWLRGLFVMCVGTGLTAGTPTADGPYALFSNIELDDVNNEAIFGPFDGYTAMLTNKYGGYFFAGDPSTSAVFAQSGTTTTNNFTFVLYIPLEIVARDPLGPVASVNNTASLTLKMAINPTASMFTTITGTLSVRIQGSQDFYWEPRKADKMGNPIMGEPPASGTTQYWTQGSVQVGAGVVNQNLVTALGYPFREYLFMVRAGDGTRATGETNFPDPLIGLKFEANMILSNYSKTLWKSTMAEQYGYTNPTSDVRTAGSIPGKENGVYVVNYNNDFFQRKPGGETRRTYLVTSPGSNFIFNGSFGGSGNTLFSVVNYVAPGGGTAARQDTRSLTGGA